MGYTIPHSDDISPLLLKALENEKANFSIKSKGDRIKLAIKDDNYTTQKIDAVARSSPSLKQESEEYPTIEEIELTDFDHSINQLVSELSQEVERIKKVIKEKSLAGEKVKGDDFEISSIKESALIKLRALLTDPRTKDKIDLLTQSLGELQSVFVNPYNLLLREALQSANLELAVWSLAKGADRAILDQADPSFSLSRQAIDWLKAYSDPKPHNATNVTHYAENVGWGYKAANLKVMEANLQSASKTMVECEVHVPPLCPVADFQVWEFLKKDIPDLEPLWNKFLQSFDPVQLQKFMQAKTHETAAKVALPITREGAEILNKIQAKIEGQFSQKQYSSLLLKEWLQVHNPVFVIIRSTGKEDSDTAANAGGNASLPFVRPNEKEISKAMGEVISSYFGEKSIIQRLQAGDRSLFVDKPFLPVMVQEMVCETHLGGRGSDVLEIPRSGVLFTKRPGRADGVVEINSSLGSNEGVVSSQVVVDTFSVHAGGIHKIVRDKEVRFVQDESDGKVHVGPVRNSSMGLRRPAALTENMAHDLSSLATNFATMYGGGQSVKPMDFEFTILMKPRPGAEGVSKMVPVIYPLQIRPLLSSTKLNPSVLNLAEVRKLNPDNVVTATTLLDGDCSTVTIDDAYSQVIFADDLPQALYRYQKHQNPANVRAIITKKSAPLTSHEAVTLARAGVPVLPITDINRYHKARQALLRANADSPTFVDSQRGLVAWGEGKKAKDLVVIGLITYPGPREYSLPYNPREFSALREGLSSEERAKRLVSLYQETHKLIGTYLKSPADIERLGKLSPKELMDQVAMAEPEEAQKALAYLARLLLLSSLDKDKELIKGQIIDGDPAKADLFLKAKIRVFEEVFHLLKNEIFPALADVGRNPPQSMNRLYFLKPLEALLYQEGSIKVLESYSFGNIAHDVASLAEIYKILDAHKLAKDSTNSWLVAIGKSHGYTHDVRTQWYECIAKLTPDNKIELIKTLQLLDEFGMQEHFVNILFRESWKAERGNADAVFKKIMSAITKEADTFGWLREKQTTLLGFEEQIGYWGVASFVEKNLPKLHSRVQDLGFVLDGKLNQLYEDASPFGKLAILNYTRRAVTAYDASIKGLTASQLFESPQAKAKAFCAMLQPYGQMMETVMNFPDDMAQWELMKDSGGDASISFYDYKNGLKSGQNYLHGDLFHDLSKVPQDMQESIRSQSNEAWEHPRLGFVKQYYHSKGIDEIAKEIQAPDYSKEKAEEELTVRSKFSVDGFIPGSKLDRSYSVHWPSRLEEHFTAEHQTMEKIIKTELTKHGMNSDILPPSLLGMCETFNTIFGLQPSSINKVGDNLEVVYEVPLRQHAGRVTFTMNAHKPDTPIAMEVKVSGVEESDRWKRTATLAALMAIQLEDLNFHQYVSPTILYKDPTQVSFALDIPRGYAGTEQLFKKMLVMMKENTMKDPVDPKFGPEEGFEATVVRGKGNQFQELFHLETIDDWRKVEGEFFQSSLYLNLYLLDYFAGIDDLDMVTKIVLNTIEGLLNYSLKDYEGHYKSKFAENPTTSLVQGIEAAVKHLSDSPNRSPEDLPRLITLVAGLKAL